MSPQNGMHISIYMPTYRAGADTQQNPIRFKNMLREAHDRLLATSLAPDAIEELLGPLQPYAEDYDFWQHQSDGLAVLRRPDTLQLFCLPLAFEEMVVAGQHFHLKPLLPYLTGDGRFYVLALSQNAVRLMQCTRHHVSEMNLDQVPKSLAEALRFDDPEQHLQFHTGTSSGGDRRAAMYHGQGGEKETAKDDLLEYFRQIDHGLHDLLRNEQAPLVVAGVDYLHPIYRQANTYRHLTEDGITGNCDHLTETELQSKGWDVVEPIFNQAQADAIATYERSVATGQASDDLETILLAAHYGRVDTLFVTLGMQQWGTYDPESQHLQLTKENEGNATDLLNLAAIQTVLNGGTVYAVEADQMPTVRPLSAVFRY